MTVPEMIEEINEIRKEIQKRSQICDLVSSREMLNGNTDVSRILSYRSSLYSAADERFLFGIEFLTLVQKEKAENDVL